MDSTTVIPPIPDFVNARRRKTLNRYTILAVLSYQLPVGVAFLAKLFRIANYSYADIGYAYIAFLSCSLTALSIIRFKNQITRRFIFCMLHFQTLASMVIAGYLVYVMGDQRYLVPIGCLLILIFVFVQSTLFASLLTIALTVTMYLAASYIGIVVCGQPGSFIGDVLYILIFVPVSMFIAYMSKIMQDQQQKIKTANSRLKNAHAELEATHDQLETVHTELESHNDRMMDSIRYAEMIQRSLLPGIDRIKAISPDSMFIWMPKDIVGGDIFYTYAAPDVSVIALMDCTGHGVPGAFLTIIVYSEIRKIIMDEGCRTPSEILSRLNRAVKNVLHRNSHGTRTDDGLDAAVCCIAHKDQTITFAGARIPLFYVKNGELIRQNGDRQSIGYQDSDDDFIFTDHTIDADDTCSFYLKSDGVTDQLGGEKQLRFGTEKFKQLIIDNHHTSYREQRKIFLGTLTEFMGDHEQKDDITLIGFRI